MHNALKGIPVPGQVSHLYRLSYAMLNAALPAKPVARNLVAIDCFRLKPELARNAILQYGWFEQGEVELINGNDAHLASRLVSLRKQL
ncbi:hypothetical protein [Achromobacter insuavis]|uniref:hypothetical protein n=1 Tax=Achromobacter insuavis TaxID=1287735 RepID=UPI001EEB8DFB|nr:hypothetical protein [Achromobacter insuavis]